LPVSSTTHLTGIVERAANGPVLRTDGGGTWELDNTRQVRKFIGSRVEVVGERSGFNGFACDQIWPGRTASSDCIQTPPRIPSCRSLRRLWSLRDGWRGRQRARLMLSDWELWACANHVLQTHGDKAPLHVAEQIGALALAGDEAGIRTWQAIAERIVQLSSNAPDRPLQ
jgi:hypothetical protein